MKSIQCVVGNYLFGVSSSYYDHKINFIKTNIKFRQIIHSAVDFAVANCEGDNKFINNKVIKTCNYILVCCEVVYESFIQFDHYKFIKHNIEFMVFGLCYSITNINFNIHTLVIFLLKMYSSRKETSSTMFERTTTDDTQNSRVPSLNEGWSNEDSVDIVSKCTAQQEGILCQCTDCAKFIRTFDRNQCKIEQDNTAHLKPYICHVCNQSFRFKCRLKRHIATHSGNKNFPCDICGRSYTKNISLKYHKLLKHSDANFPPITCEMCSKTYLNKKSLNKHVRIVHFGQGALNRVTCSHCSKTFSDPKGLQRHLNKAHLQINHFICDYCGRVLYDKTHLIVHIKHNHLPQESHTCQHCGFASKKIITFNRHMLAKHSNSSYSCETCGKVFSLKQQLLTHRVSHLDQKPFICQTCGKSFKRESNLMQHQYVHSDERPHKCEICGLDFRLKTHVKQHMAVHGTVKTRVLCALKNFPEKSC